MIKAVLFDMDGVLVDSEEYICRAAILMFLEKGFRVEEKDFLPFVGAGENRYLGGVAEKHGIPFELEKDKARCYEIYRQITEGKLTALPGASAFIRKCKDKGYKTALATSADEIKMNINLNGIGLPSGAFNATVNGLEVKNKKPDPEIYLRAAELLATDPEDCLVVEDAVNGIRAGKAAGMKCLALLTSFSRDELFEADWIYPDLAGVPPDFFEKDLK